MLVDTMYSSEVLFCTITTHLRNFVLKFLVIVLVSLYLFNVLIHQADTLYFAYILIDNRYWSEVVCCIITTHLSDLEVKVLLFTCILLS